MSPRRSQDMSQVPPLLGLAMGGLFAAAGLTVVFVSLGWIPVDPSSVHAPMWVLGLAGGMFLLPGLLMCYYAVRNGLAPDGAVFKEKPWGGPGWFVGAVMVTGFAAMALWVGFGGGPRQFSGGVTGSEREGRLVFGGSGLVCATLAIWIWFRGLKEIFRGRD
ncbi:MAG: hypothetical protein OEO23_09265 [Gemmatimonadota bacterium]|nr:hypothetical protein [Gemmatimonadota bacterium]